MKGHYVGKVKVPLMKVLVFACVAVFCSVVVWAQATASEVGIVETTTDVFIPGNSYHGEALDDNGGVSLMPVDLTFTETDVPKLLNSVATSQYEAIYLDMEMYLRVTKDGDIQESGDNGITWDELTTTSVDAREYAEWLCRNDQNPGYSIKEMQIRLENGATVKHSVFKNGNEIYFVMDDYGTQIILVQPEKSQSVLVDGKRMMITSDGNTPFFISKNMLQSFYDLLVSCDIIPEMEAALDYTERIDWIEDSESFVVGETFKQ